MKTRLDHLLVTRGLATSRAQVQGLIMAGQEPGAAGHPEGTAAGGCPTFLR